MSDVQIAVIDQQDTQIALAVPGIQGAVGPAFPANAIPDGTAAAPGVAFTNDPDTGIFRPGANRFAFTTGGVLRNEVNEQGNFVYYGDAIFQDGSSFQTTLQTVTPTVNRTISFPDATGTVALVAGSSGQLLYNASGANAGLSTVITDGNNITLGGRVISGLNGAASAPPGAFVGTWFTGGTSTTTKPQVLIEPTGTTSTSWSTSGTGFGVNAASGFVGRLLDLQVNGSGRFNVNSTGHITLTGSGASATLSINAFGDAFSSDRQLNFGNNTAINSGGLQCRGGGSNVRLVNSSDLSWYDSDPASGTADVRLFRDAANTLAQRNAANAQTFRCYGTYTDASNYVRLALSSTSTAVTLAAETAGTGADDIPLNLTAAGTGTIKVNSVAEVVVSSTVAGLPAAPVVGMLTRVTDATAPAVGSTVTGGGAAAALCWYNGANWSVIGV
jgi:hypothetical protein